MGTEVIVAGGYHRSDASGHDLRIVCFNAADSTVLWETREDRALPNMSKVPALAMDADGNVLVGWDYWAVGSGNHTVVTKLAGSDGRKLWEWKAQAAGQQSGHLAVPIPDAQGRVWVAGIQQVAGGEYRRFLGLLDTGDGATRWQSSLNSARDANDRRAAVYPLSGGDALVIAPPQGGEGLSPWLIRRISGANGATVWHREFTRDNDRNLPNLSWVIDERRTQFVALVSQVGSKAQLTRIAYDLLTGAERWQTVDSEAGELQGGITAATLSNNGDIIVWSRNTHEATHRKWWRWHREDGFWFPETTTTQHEQPLRITVSGHNGALLKRDLIARKDERIQAIVIPAAGQNQGAMFLRSMIKKEQFEPWRVVWLTDGGRAITREFVRRPGGPGAKLWFPRLAVVTPSGRIAIAGDPSEEKPGWQITAW
jgi:outer membrane protein assembly factor BamB